MPKTRVVLLVAAAFVLAGCTADFGARPPFEGDLAKQTTVLRELIAKDVLRRRDSDFYFYESESQNVAKILHDCEFSEVRLSTARASQVIVKLNWFPDANSEFAGGGYNFFRGAQDNGDYYVYAISESRPVFLGSIYGNSWGILERTKEGFHSIETWSPESVGEGGIRC